MPRLLTQIVRHRLFHDVVILFGVQVASYLLPLLTLPYLTRTLGPFHFGLLALAVAWVNYFAVIIDYGFAVIGTRSVATANSDHALISSHYCTIFAAKLLLLALCLLLHCLGLLFLPQLRQYPVLYTISFLYAIGYGFSPNWFFQGLQQVRAIAIADYTAKILSIVLIFMLIHSPEDYIIAAGIQSGVWAIASLTGHIIIWRTFRPSLKLPTFAAISAVFRESWPLFMSIGVVTIVASTNTFVLGFFSSPTSVGIWNAAQRLIIAVRALTNPLTNAIYPEISKRVAQSPVDALIFLRKQILLTSAPFLLISICQFVFAPNIVNLLYGKKFADTVFVLRILSPIPFAHAVSMCFSTYFMLAFGYEKQFSRIIRVLALINFAILGMLLPWLDPLLSVSIASLAVDLSSVAATYWFYRRHRLLISTLA